METLSIRTTTQTAMINISSQIQELINKYDWKDGLLTVFIPHTTAGVTINENADPDVTRDITNEINKIVPFDDNYHHFEGNSAAHIKSTLFSPSLSVIVENRNIMLGTWQGIYFCEFDGPRNRKIWVKFIKSN
ncbi:MAG: secondary thiamine-phosphate synthase enzyme YjbQ [Calditrichaceae bacterium]|jgi:secondary thiamine-phosphate synthase enzyme